MCLDVSWTSVPSHVTIIFRLHAHSDCVEVLCRIVDCLRGRHPRHIIWRYASSMTRRRTNGLHVKYIKASPDVIGFGTMGHGTRIVLRIRLVFQLVFLWYPRSTVTRYLLGWFTIKTALWFRRSRSTRWHSGCQKYRRLDK